MKIELASALMVDELSRQLGKIHGIDIPQPKTVLFIDWGDAPFGAAWHFWNPHNQSWVIAKRMRHPIAEVNFYICGEAYAARQSWVEYAINSAEKLLQEHFSLPRAAWLSPSYDLGP